MEAKVLPLTYFGNLAYFKILLASEELWIDDEEIYLKQTFRNRMQILAANGTLGLSVPVLSPKGKELKSSEIKISYDDAWQAKHVKTIRSAYRSSPFYDEYAEDINQLINTKYIYLNELNKAILTLLLKLLNIDKHIHFSSIDPIPPNSFSYRGYFKPSKSSSEFTQFTPYVQVFNYKYDFQSNLSILDLLFNEGPYALSYLLNEIS
jgi:hypothetical protein